MSTPADSAQLSVDAFEASLRELEALVARMEQGELSLDETLQSFERGMGLYKQCQLALDRAQLRIEQVLRAEDPDSRVPFEPDAP
jgi:exodeoxyribonuclease VII small subunit